MAKLDFIPDKNQNAGFIPDRRSRLNAVERGLLGALEGGAEVGRGLHDAAWWVINKIAQRDLASKIPGAGGADIQTQVLSAQDENTPAAQIGRFLGELGTAVAGGPEVELLAASGVPRALGAAGVGATYGALTSHDDPAMGAILGGAGGAIAQPIAAGVSKLLRPREAVLSHLENAVERKGALSPAEAQDNIARNFVDEQGNQLPADIGKISNNKGLQTLYNMTQYVPGSGTADAMNAVKFGQHSRMIADAERDLNDLINEPTESKLNESIRNRVAGLLSDTDAGASLNKKLSGELQKEFRAQRKIGNELYAPINNSKLRIDKLGAENYLPNYMDKARDILSRRAELQDIFGTGSDLGNKLNKELDVADSILKNKDAYPLTLENALTRSRNLNDLAGRATNAGKYNEARQLGNLKDALDMDVENHLLNSGNDQLHAQLTTANNHWRQNVAPFRSTKRTTDAIYKGVVSNPNLLSKDIFGVENEALHNVVSDDVKNMALYKLLTRNKVGLDGTVKASADEVHKNLMNLGPEARTLISKSHPLISEELEAIPGIKENMRSTKNLESEKNKLIAQLEKIRDQRYTSNLAQDEKSGRWTSLLKLAGTGGAAGLAAAYHPAALLGGIPMAAAGRVIAKTLRDPDLIKRYLAGEGGKSSPQLQAAIAQMLGQIPNQIVGGR